MADKAPVSVTFKAGRDFDAPWIVVSDTNVPAIQAHMRDMTPEFLEEVATKAKQFANAKSMRLVPAEPGLGVQSVDAHIAAVAAVSEAIPGSEEQELPASATPKCEHGMRKWFAPSTYKGEQYPAGWACPLPKSDKSRCKNIRA